MTKKIIITVFVIAILLFLGNVVYFAFRVPNVALLSLNGIITQNRADELIRAIKNIEKSKNIKAVLIKINSPGGEAVSSQRIYLSIRKLSKTKPVVSLIETTGASGAYYAACGANRIVCYPASVVGSIGVIFESINIAQLSKKLGIKAFIVKSGKLKDAANPFKEPTQNDREMIKSLVDDIYNEFLEDVSKSRGIPKNKLKRYANGAVYSGKTALKIGLVDSIGGEEEAKMYIKKLAHIKHIRFERFNNDSLKAAKIIKGIGFIDNLELLKIPSVKAVFQ
ncbi:signal peptide peptidase SppA [Hippea sp. KM1]|uniref:signal peptide peptidase SppA n=1 Tax=Hippea sp. KM1 TaxID=944481 RepID=UPI00046D6A9A|nr:signal peptide peptidase SppA [Hippea sp. KM1]